MGSESWVGFLSVGTVRTRWNSIHSILSYFNILLDLKGYVALIFKLQRVRKKVGTTELAYKDFHGRHSRAVGMHGASCMTSCITGLRDVQNVYLFSEAHLTYSRLVATTASGGIVAPGNFRFVQATRSSWPPMYSPL